MPSPKKGEAKKEFLGRCMAHPHTQKWKSDQRYAICNSFWDKHLNEHEIVNEKDMRGEIQSKSQRRLMGWVHACNKGLTTNCPSSIKDIAKGFKKKKDLKKMASHKEKGLPEKIGEAHKPSFKDFLIEEFKYQLEGKIINIKNPMSERIAALRDLIGKDDVTKDDVEEFCKNKIEQFQQEEMRNSARVN